MIDDEATWEAIANQIWLTEKETQGQLSNWRAREKIHTHAQREISNPPV